MKIVKIVNFDVVQLSISDHAQVNTVRTAHYEPIGTRMIETQFMKIFSKAQFVTELE